MRFIVMDFSGMNCTIIKQNLGNAFQLAPATFAKLAIETGALLNSPPFSDLFNLCDRAEQFEVLPGHSGSLSHR